MLRKALTFILTATAMAGIFMSSPAAAGTFLLDGLQPSEENQRFIIKYRDRANARTNLDAMNSSLQLAARAVPTKAGSTLSINRIRTLAVGGAEVITTSRPLNRVDAETLIRQLASDPNVEYVEVDAKMYPTWQPNDPKLSQQWAFGNSAASINVQSAWEYSRGDGIVVAVLDTGTTNHPDLSPAYLPGYDFISDADAARDGDGRDPDPSDMGDWSGIYDECNVRTSSWHGTHVAGTIAARTNNGVGVAGTAPGARILPVRVLGKCGGYSSDIADGIVWAAGGAVPGVPLNPNPAQVINMSLGGVGACSITYQNAINQARSRGVTVVVSAGNNSQDVSEHLPSNCSGVIAVAAITTAGSRASFSNYGQGITLSAPGTEILSTSNTGYTVPEAANYVKQNGTSMATPHVAGVVALMQAAASTPLSPDRVASILRQTARPLPRACREGCGAGIVDAVAAVIVSKGGVPEPTRTYSNSKRVTAARLSTSVQSSIPVANRTAKGLPNTTVNVSLSHYTKVNVSLIAPSGRAYSLHRYSIISQHARSRYAVDLSSEPIQGVWRLSVSDGISMEKIYGKSINSWSITF